MSAEYTPTTAVVRSRFSTVWTSGLYAPRAERPARRLIDQFDRWLEAHDAEVAARALRDAAEEWASDPEPVGDTSADYRNWLRDRADRIEATR